MSTEHRRDPTDPPRQDHEAPDHLPESTGRQVFRGVGEFQSDSTAVSIVSYLISGPAVFGGVGWLIDTLLDTTLFLPIGILGGMALSIYLIWFRYGKT